MDINNIPKHWQVKKLGEVCQFTQGIQIEVNKQKDYQFENSVRFLRIIDFTQTGEPPRYIENPGYRYLLKKGEIAMVRYGTVGFVCIGKEGAIANNLFKINHNQEINSKYLINFLQSLFFLSKLETKGATMQALSFGLIKPIPIPIPPLPEQLVLVSKIEELLSDLENGKQQLLTAQQQLKVYRQSLLKAAFTSTTLSDRNTIFKDYILKDVTQKIQIGPFGTQLHKEDYIENGVPLINPMHILDGKIEANFSYSIKEEKRNSLPNYILEEGDVIMGRRGEMGRCGLVTNKEKGWFCGTGSLYFRPLKEKLNSRFLFYYLTSQPIKKYLNDNAGGTTMANLNLKIVNEIPISLPSLKEQQQIVEILESKLTVCEKIEETISQSLLQTETLRQSILKKAFEGKLV